MEAAWQLTSKVDWSALGTWPLSPLHVAAWHGHVQVVGLLLAHGADMDSRAHVHPCRQQQREGRCLDGDMTGGTRAGFETREEFKEANDTGTAVVAGP